MSTQITPPQLASPFDAIFADYDEAQWGFNFLHQTLALLNAGTNEFRPCVFTLPKSHKLRLLRFNFGPWLLVDFCGPASTYDKRINLALLTGEFGIDPRKHWLSFNYPYDRRGVSIYKFTWKEIRAMDNELIEHYEVSMHYASQLFANWKGSPYRLAHQPQIFAAAFDPTVRADLLQNGLDPMFVHRTANQDE
jgi:hypothetical protein